MPQKTDNSPPDWNDIEDECQHIPINCPWTIVSNDENLFVIITCLKWTFNYDFWIRVTVYPEENTQISNQVDIWEYSPLLESSSEALFKYYEFPEPHLIYYQLHILGELVHYLDSKFSQSNNMAATLLAYPDLALVKFSGTDPDQDAESFILLIERKINFALGDAPVNPDALANYNF